MSAKQPTMQLKSANEFKYKYFKNLVNESEGCMYVEKYLNTCKFYHLYDKVFQLPNYYLFTSFLT